MIVEQEVVEQLEDGPGRRLDWICDFIRGLGRDDPLTLLREMWHAGNVTFVDEACQPLPEWKVREMFRDGVESVPFHVRATARGLKCVHG